MNYGNGESSKEKTRARKTTDRTSLVQLNLELIRRNAIRVHPIQRNGPKKDILTADSEWWEKKQSQNKAETEHERERKSSPHPSFPPKNGATLVPKLKVRGVDVVHIPKARKEY